MVSQNKSFIHRKFRSCMCMSEHFARINTPDGKRSLAELPKKTSIAYPRVTVMRILPGIRNNIFWSIACTGDFFPTRSGESRKAWTNHVPRRWGNSEIKRGQYVEKNAMKQCLLNPLVTRSFQRITFDAILNKLFVYVFGFTMLKTYSIPMI